jgi:hypothetical protein
MSFRIGVIQSQITFHERNLWLRGPVPEPVSVADLPDAAPQHPDWGTPFVI